MSGKFSVDVSYCSGDSVGTPPTGYWWTPTRNGICCWKDLPESHTVVARLQDDHNLLCYQGQLWLGVDANVQLKSSISIGAKVEISPKSFILGFKAEIEKIFSITPQDTNKCWTLWPCIDPNPEKRIPLNVGSQFATLGANFQHLLVSWHQCSSSYYYVEAKQQSKNAQR